MVPIPRVSSWEELNIRLEAESRKRRLRRLRGHTETIGERFERDHATMLPLPAAPYEACEKIAGRVSSLSLVRYRLNDYSVPTEYGHRQVWVKGYVHQVVIACGSEVIARHERSANEAISHISTDFQGLWEAWDSFIVPCFPSDRHFHRCLRGQQLLIVVGPIDFAASLFVTTFLAVRHHLRRSRDVLLRLDDR